MKRIALISPNIVSQKGDVAGTGIPYFPFGLVYLATYLRENKQAIQFIDSFSENPFQIREKDGYLFQGLKTHEILRRLKKDVELVILYAGQVYAHRNLLEIVRACKQHGLTVLIVENTQAVTAYSLQHAYRDFFDEGADFVLAGEPEPRIFSFLDMLAEKLKPKDIDGLVWRDKKGAVHINEKKIFQDVDTLPFPDWGLLNLKNYWKVRYAHAPLTRRKYLPLLTSRGCPMKCRFCVVLETNRRRWRPRNAISVVDEIEYNLKRFGVKEFHLEDLNPTINKKRMVDISKEILRRKLKVDLKFASGTKAETYDLDTIQWMSRAGFSYISISPESGSPRVLKLMDKYFDHKFAIEQVREMHKVGIASQACFVLGFPGETKKDLQITQQYIKKLTKAGLDEIALFIMTPVPGSAAFTQIAPEFGDISKLTFTPSWRPEYEVLNRWRKKLVWTFLITKLLYHPGKLFTQALRIFTGSYKTKIEMTIARLIKTHLLFKRA